MSAALNAVRAKAAAAGMAVTTTSMADIELGFACEPIAMPDGSTIVPPSVLGRPVHELVCDLIDWKNPAKSRFVRLVGPPGTGKSRIARAIAHHAWTKVQGKPVEERHGQPFYGLVELSPGPSSDELFFRYEFVPDKDDASRIKLVESTFVQAMRNGWVVVIDEVNVARDVALLSINATLDGRLALHLPATGETVIAQPGFAVLLTYNPGLVGQSDIPEAWYSRFPASIEIRSNWAALAKARPEHEKLVKAAKKLDDKRVGGSITGNSLTWTPQFREIDALADMIDRVGELLAVALFVGDMDERSRTGQEVGPSELKAVIDLLDDAGLGHLHLDPKDIGSTRNHGGYPVAIAG
jgi:hypothetical protein